MLFKITLALELLYVQTFSKIIITNYTACCSLALIHALGSDGLSLGSAVAWLSFAGLTRLWVKQHT